MYLLSRQRSLAAASLLATAAVFAQDKPAAPAESASAPRSGEPAAVTFQSALQGYRPFSEEAVAPWRQTNETVRQAGGWREYAKEAAGAKGPERKPDSHESHHAPAGQPKATP